MQKQAAIIISDESSHLWYGLDFYLRESPIEEVQRDEIQVQKGASPKKIWG